MKSLILNPGSTSLKYSLFIGKKCIEHAQIKPDQDVFAALAKKGLIKDNYEIDGFGVRVVHGGHLFQKPTQITAKILAQLEEISELAPLHNPPAVAIIKHIFKLNPKAKITAVFDTAFHASIPKYASLYAIPQKLSQKYHIQKYGFHGIVCQSVIKQLQKEKGKIPGNLIVCHLGGGCSITAIKNGKSIDTSMGFTPLEGLIMATRSGDIDAGILLYLSEKTGKNLQEIEAMLSKESGLLGIAGTSDMREILAQAENGSESAQLAIDAFVYRIQKYIFSYVGVLGGLDCLVFSGGIGEGSFLIRKRICENLKLFGISIDSQKNKAEKMPRIISKKTSQSEVWVIEPREDEVILKAVY